MGIARAIHNRPKTEQIIAGHRIIAGLRRLLVPGTEPERAAGWSRPAQEKGRPPSPAEAPAPIGYAASGTAWSGAALAQQGVLAGFDP